MPDDTTTWALIHAERAALADMFDTLTADQWNAPSLCGGWTVKMVVGHLVAGAEQTGPQFVKGLASAGFRFNAMTDRQARGLGALGSAELVERLRARTSTTNHPPAPVVAMLGEAVVHGDDIRRPLGLSGAPSPEALIACLEMYKAGNFPVGGKKRIAGLRLVATDTDWSHGSGPLVTGPGVALLSVVCGRPAALTELSGDGIPTLRGRLHSS
jgi:uncharacterized protein (TIGR03083 family)